MSEKAKKEPKEKKEPSERQQLTERHLRARTEKIELELSAKRGELIEVETVRGMLFQIASKTKERLEILPESLARKLANMKDPAEVEALLKREISAALTELSREGTKGVPLKDDDEDERPARRKKIRAAADPDDDDEEDEEDEDDDEDGGGGFDPYA